MTRRTLRVGVLVLWASFFTYLWLSDAATRFIGPRTAWVVPFGAIVLVLTTVAQVFTKPQGDEQSAGGTEVLGMILLVTPMIALSAVPDAGLGSLAASRKTAGGGIAALTSILPPDDPNHEISFADIHWASESEEYAIAAGIAEGLEMRLEGFVSGSQEGAGRFTLTRFYIACCAADAVPYSVTIEPPEGLGEPGGYPEDTWLAVSGQLERSGAEYVLVPDSIEAIEAPKDPFLY